MDEAGRAYPLQDPLAAELADLHRRAQACAGVEERARAFTGFTPVFGDLAGHPALVPVLARALQALETRGVRGALESAA